MSDFSITEGKYLLSFECEYDFDEIMQRDGWGWRSWNGDADVKGYPPALEYVVFGVPKDIFVPEISREIPEGLEIGLASTEYKEKFSAISDNLLAKSTEIFG